MSEVTSPTQQVIEQAPGAHLAVMKRSLQMRQFKTKSNVLHCVQNQVIVPLGQIVGVGYQAIDKEGALPDGTLKTSVLIMGDFEGTVYETGEVITAAAAYLPGYFADAIKAALTAGQPGRPVQFAIEIVAEPTGIDEKTGLPKGIPFAYGIRNLIARQAENPLEAMKRQLQKSNMLRLPPPVPLPRASRIALPARQGSAPEMPALSEAEAEGESVDDPAPETLAEGTDKRAGRKKAA